jgi:E3 SUMO-protein ligase PIAS1
VAWQQANAHIDNKRLPIEYPSVPEVHVDEYPIPFKERGLRGKAGSAPPFDLNRSTRGIVLLPGRMMNVAFAHSGPTTGKKKDQSKVSGCASAGVLPAYIA